MPKRLDVKQGTRYGRLVVIKEVEPKKANHGNDRRFLCECDCGNVIVTLLRSLRFGRTTSCGCRQRETAIDVCTARRVHRDDTDSNRLYSIWRGMKSRCHCKGSHIYERYGAMGIKVCNEWRNDFLAFYHWSMGHGYKDGLTIDRIDGRGDYEPSNCRWATMKEQSNNTKRNVFITHNGETHTVTEWSRLTGIGRTTLQLRLKKGWDEDVLFSEPIHGGERKKGQCYGKKR